MDSVIWLGFFLAILTILVISRLHLGASLLAAALVLAIFTMGPGIFGILGLETFTDPGIILMALAVALIPMIGGYMETSGHMDSLVSNLRVSRRAFLGSVPALMGMLPMPGGALLSAPMVKKGSEGVSPEAKAALNVWFRHVIYLIYPISTALIVSTYLAGLPLYEAIPYLLPFFVLITILGYVFLLREGRGKIIGRDKFSLGGLLIPLSVLLAAPLIDFTILKSLNPGIREISLVIGVGASFIMAAYLANTNLKRSWKVALHMRPWNFGSIIFGMFLFLAVFQHSGVPELIGGLGLSNPALCIGVGFLLGLATGRIQVPASIIIPIYLGSAGVSAMNPWHFAITYASIFMGYVISPVHPCVSVSLEYFNVGLKEFLRKTAVSTAIMMIILIIAGILAF